MIWHPSPNFGPRRGGQTCQLVVLHYTAIGSAIAAREWLCNPEAEVSAHYLIDRDGASWQLVDEAMRAWHAGNGAWRGQDDVNSRSIGVELVNTGAEPFPDPQMRALEALLRAIMTRWPVKPEGVIGHSDMAPGRKIDPGPRFDWRRLARQGLSVWPTPEGCTTPSGQGTLDEALHQAGYTADVPTDVRLNAFRLRFRPGAAGPADEVDTALLTQLA